MHVRAREEEPDTELSPAKISEAAPVQAPKRQSPRRWALLGLGVAALVAALVGLPRMETASDTETDGVADLTRSPRTDAVDGPEPSIDEGAASEANSELTRVDRGANSDGLPTRAPGQSTKAETSKGEERAPKRRGRGKLFVVVQPWGNVWVDGVWMGRAPVEARVTKGRHVVEAGRDLPSAKRIVRIDAGTRKEVEISLGE